MYLTIRKKKQNKNTEIYKNINWKLERNNYIINNNNNNNNNYCLIENK